MCSDSVTPCSHQGYEFQEINGQTLCPNCAGVYTPKQPNYAQETYSPPIRWAIYLGHNDFTTNMPLPLDATWD
jgi:hypothetical protein